MKYAPIALFVYNRPEHLRKSLSSLNKNLEVKFSSVYIFSDGPKNNDRDIQKVKKVREIVKNLNFFKKKKIIERKQNIGLKQNIISGINHVLKFHNKIIVLEDDLIFSNNFIDYMNNSLNKYIKHKSVWHISGWNYDLRNKEEKSAFFIKNMNCWGWGTWKNRWEKLNLNSEFLIKKIKKKGIEKFDLENSFQNYSQLIRNKKKKISTWAIFWNATIFLNDGLCLNPFKTLTVNIGQDKSGTNNFNIKLENIKIGKYKITNYPNDLNENKNARLEIVKFLKKKNYFKLIFNKIYAFFR